MLANRFGQFLPDGRTFRIHDHDTPMPWVNVISTGRFGLVISQNGGGFSFFDDAQHCVITRWEMDLVRDCYGKFLYLADLDAAPSPHVWSLAPAPTRPAYQSFECDHTTGSTTFRTRYSDIAAEWKISVAADHPAEVWTVKITNQSGVKRRLRLSSYMEWCCGVAPDTKREFHRLFFTVSHDPARHAILATKNMWDVPPKSEAEHWNKPWPYVAAHAMVMGSKKLTHEHAVADKTLFLGKYGSTAKPRAMTASSLNNSGFGRFSDPIAASGGDFSLEPGESIEFGYVLTIASDVRGVHENLDALNTLDALHKSQSTSTGFWNTLLAPTSVATDRDDFNVLNNTWLPYQAISGRLFGRTGYYQQSGAFGYRDQLQDSQVWLPLAPERCLAQIMRHAAKQFVDGSVYHWWHELADFGNHTACSDDYLWLAFITANYLKETGDFAALTKTARFVDSAETSTLQDHCLRSIRRTFKRTSARGLPFIGSCDWNDGLSAMGLEEKGESVWLAMFLCQILADWGTILETTGDSALASELRAKRDQYIKAIETHAWDGSYYKAATKDSGEWIGSSTCAEGKIHLNPQTWAILADIAVNPRSIAPEISDRGHAAWEAVRSKLLTAYGPLLIDPAYTVPDPTIGYITRYSPGSRENGGVYMHAATWALAAACKMKDRASVEKIFDSVSPPLRGSDAASYYAEPYVMPGNVDGQLSDTPGRAGWTWYTGSAAWLNRVCMEWVLGIRPTWQGLVVDPVPPASFGKIEVARHWRGTEFTFVFDAASFVEGAVPSLVVNGQVFRGNVIQAELLPSLGKKVRVDVSWSGVPTVSMARRPSTQPLG